MSETKTIIYPEAGGFGNGRGMEGMLLGSAMNGGGFGGGGMWNNPIWAIVFLAALRNGGIFGNGYDSNGNCGCSTQNQLSAIQETLSTNQGNTLLMDAIEDSRKDREISALTAQLASVNARAERQAELAPIVQQLNEIACKQPQTVTLPYSCATAVPTAMVYNGLYGLSPNQVWS